MELCHVCVLNNIKFAITALFAVKLEFLKVLFVVDSFL